MWPRWAETSASMVQKYGTSSAAPAARWAAIPWRIWAILLALALHGQRPPTQARSQGPSEESPARSRATAASACSCTAGTSRRNCETKAAIRAYAQTIGMRQVCQRQGSWTACQGLLWVPQEPEGHAAGSAANTRILANAEHRARGAVWRVACDAFLQVLAGSRQRAKEEPRSRGHVGDGPRAPCWACANSNVSISRAVCNCAVQDKTATTKQDRDKLWRLAHLLTQRVCPVGVLHLRRCLPFRHLQRRAEGNVQGQGLLVCQRSWQGLEQLNPGGEVADGFQIGRAVAGLLPARCQ